MTRDQALAKIKKCLALAASSNPHEAATAMRQAQKLMAEYNISSSDPTLAGVRHETAKARTATFPAWEASLARMIADSFGCDIMLNREQKLSGYSVRTEATVSFIGMDSSPTIASYAWDVLSRQCAKGRAVHIANQNKRIKSSTKTARGDAYALGWVNGVREKLTAFAQPAETLQLIESYMAQQWPDSQTHKPIDRSQQRHVNQRDRLLGLLAGSNAQLDRGIGGREAQGLL